MVLQMEQKHAIEDMLAGALPLTSLQATLFMEEFWRPSTREASESDVTQMVTY